MPPPPRPKSRDPINPIRTEPKELPVIIDEGGWIYLSQKDWEYVNRGEKEGWLEYGGYHLDSQNNIIHRFILR